MADGAILLSGVASAPLSRAVELVRSGGRRPEITVSAYAMVTDDVRRDAGVLKPICAGIAQRGGRATLSAAGIDVSVPEVVPGVYPDLVHAEDWDHAVDVCSAWISDEDAVAAGFVVC